MMMYRLCAVGALSLLPFSAKAADLPQLKSSSANAVPACVTPGRLISFVKSRNEKVDPRFDSAAVEYMRHGETLGVRWDYAYFQMLVETGNLGFKGDVKPRQNNFAGLGATGGGVPGESFPDISSGVKAHLQHILMYAGERIDNPVAERTRKVQEWGVLTSWQKSLKGPMTFTQLTKKWSPRDGGYARDIESVADAFMSGPCKSADPRPELVAEARKGAENTKVAAAQAVLEAAPAETGAAAENNVSPKETGLDIAKRVVAEARAQGAVKSGLGAAPLAKAAETGKAAGEAAQKAPAAVTILNAPKMEPPPAAAETLRSAADSVPKAKPDAKAEKPQTVAANAAGAAAKAVATPPAAATPTKCRVWTASYGGSKAIIIKAVKDDMTNYTVLDVNDGAEKREAEAYIGAYAKGGQLIGEAYTNQDQALDKAFELCPEG